MSEHPWVHENLTSYAAGGLPPDERARVELHLAECEACAAELAECRRLDTSMERLFQEVRPEPGFEDRLLHKLRSVPWRRTSPAFRWMAAAAAMVLLGGVGALFHAAAASGGLAMPGTRKAGSLDAARSFFGVLNVSKEPSYSQLMHGSIHYGADLKFGDVDDKFVGGAAYGGQLRADGESTWNEVEKRQKAITDVLAEVKETHTGSLVIGSNVNGESLIGGKAKRAKARAVFEAIESKPAGVSKESLSPDTDIAYSEGRRADVSVPAFSKPNAVALLKRKPGAENEAIAGIMKPMGGDSSASSALSMPNKPGNPFFQTYEQTYLPGESKRLDLYAGDAKVSDKVFEDAGKQDKAEKKVEERKAPVNMPVGSAAGGGAQPPASIALSLLAKANEYYKPAEVGKLLGIKAGQRQLEVGQKQLEAQTQQSRAEPKELGKSDPKGGDDKKVGAVKDNEKKPEEAQLAVAARKIIRSGEIEFEVDVFDNTVASITKLVSAVKGGFVATVNSDKLPNGKVKGSIVVRMPPEHLDKFLLDLRQELGKTGELKGQRIGSQDVTKAYTDIESRLRAARAMEERFINIIKTGKGEIKDLIAAERELGTWRTKIEEMEGEIRFYNNQVGLSTLTITAYEKEIQSAATLVISEKVGMRLEVEDVEKAQQTALKAVADLKGRVLKSDLKSHTAGQLEAVLVVEVAPASADALREKLKALGQVTQMDSQRTQSAEGGKHNVTEAKSRVSDVQFNVALYNAANIQPRETWIVQVATIDVPGTYESLQDAVAKAKGHVRVGSVNESDKLNITATFDVDLPSTERKAFEDALAKAGTVVSRSSTQAAAGDTVTDRKVGYRLTLRNVANIQPRETWTMNVATLDVPGSYRVLQEAVSQAKGHVRAGQVNEVDKLNITATFDFDIPASERRVLDEVLAKVGPVLTRTSTQAAAGDNVTDRNVGYRLTLRNASAMQPRERVALAVEVLDVEKTVAELLDLVKAQKGLVSGAKMSRERSGRVTSTMVFDVPLGSKDGLVRAIKASGEVRLQESSRNSNVPESDLATAQIEVVLASNLPIVSDADGLWPQIRTSLSYSFQLLSYSLMLIILGLFVVVPWALLVWAVWKVYARMTKPAPPV